MPEIDRSAGVEDADETAGPVRVTIATLGGREATYTVPAGEYVEVRSDGPVVVSVNHDAPTPQTSSETGAETERNTDTDTDMDTDTDTDTDMETEGSNGS